MSGEVWAAGLRPAGRADRSPSHDADLRQHAPPGRAGDPAAVASASARTRSRAPRQPRQGAAARCRAAAQARRAEGAGGDRLARARHRHRRRRPGLPARLAALDRELPAAGRALGPFARAARPRGGCSRSRATSWSSAPRCSTAWPRGELDRLRIPEQPLDVLAQQIVAEVGGAGVGRGRALCADPPGVALPRADARGVRRRGGDAGRRLQHPARPARRAAPPRRRQPRAARAARRAADRADLRRHDPGHRRLPGAAGAREPGHRHGERGLRGREHGRRRLPARQQLVPHPARRAGRGAGRGRARRCRPTSRSGSARRRAAATSCRPRCRACGRRSPRA